MLSIHFLSVQREVGVHGLRQREIAGAMFSVENGFLFQHEVFVVTVLKKLKLFLMDYRFKC